MRSRNHYLRAISQVIANPQDLDEQQAIVQSLLLLAATTANGMSGNSIDYSSAHVTESADEMIAVLEQCFGVEMIVRAS